MLARMHRPITLGHVALVATLSFVVLAGTAAAPPSVAPTVRPTAVPTPTVDVGLQYAKAVVAAFASDPLVMRVVQTAKLTVTDGKKSVDEKVSMTLDLSDRDLSAEFLTKTGGKTTTTDLGMVVLGKTVYARDGGRSMAERSAVQCGTEHRGRDPDPADHPISPAHFRYVGVSINRQAEAPAPHRCSPIHLRP